MTFLNPIALFFALTGGVIVLMYLLKLRRKREEFSSTLLWRKSLEDLIANAPFQKLRQNLLMYLQILLLLLLALALARPTLWLSRTRGATHVLMIDNTASMNAADGPGGTTRLDEAKAAALRIVGNLRAGDQAMVIAFGGRARVVQAATAEAATLRRAITALEPTDAGCAIRDALLLAKSVRKVNDNAVITLISDGGVGYLGNLVGEKDAVEFVGVGKGDDNRAIVAFDVRESFEKRGQLQVFAEVENFATQPAETLLRCLIDGKLAQVKEAKIDAKGKQGFIFTGIEAVGKNRLLRLELANPDLLAADDAVQGIINLQSTVRVLLVSKGNFFMERIMTLVPGAKVELVAPEAYKPGGGYDLVVFDQWSPPTLGPGRYLMLDAVPPLPGFKRAEQRLKTQSLVDWNRLHPITRFVNFDNLAVTDALNLTAADWTVALAESAEAPLILAGENQGLRLVCVAFDIYNTDWPLQPSFPIFFANAAQWLTVGARGSLEATAHATGATIQMQSGEEIEIKGPDGRVWRPTRDDQGVAYFGETLRAGMYEARMGKAAEVGAAAGGQPAFAPGK